MKDPVNTAECVECGASYPAKRAALGYRTCFACGEQAAREARTSWCVAPIAHKQGATLVTQKEQLRGLNPKRNEV
jgi:ribosomal protein L37AE/L43A